MYKTFKIKDGKFPAKVAEEIPRNKLFLDLIGTNVVHRNGKKKKNLNSVTMVDPVTE